MTVDTGDGAALVGAMIDEMRELYDGLDLNAPDMPSAGAAELGPPGGTFWSAIAMARPFVLAASSDCRTAACEIKRMYVVPAARRQGLARALLRALEDAARGLGYDIARLDTGPRQPHARSFYESEGYVPIGNFNGNPAATFFGEKRLSR